MSLRGLFSSIDKELSEISDAIKDFGDGIAQKNIVLKESNGFSLAFHAEKSIIESSINISEKKIGTDKYLSTKSEEFRKLYDSHLADINKLFDQKSEGMGGVISQRPEKTFTIPPVPTRQPHPDPHVNEAIEEALLNIAKEREAYFRDVRNRLKGNEKLQQLVKLNLHEWGCGECWQHIA